MMAVPSSLRVNVAATAPRRYAERCLIHVGDLGHPWGQLAARHAVDTLHEQGPVELTGAAVQAVVARDAVPAARSGGHEPLPPPAWCV